MKPVLGITKFTLLGFLLVLSLACVAMAETSAATSDQSSKRKGGQAGQESHLEKKTIEPVSQERPGGQAGYESPLEERKMGYGDAGGKRVGGQAGLEFDQKKTEEKGK